MAPRTDPGQQLALVLAAASGAVERHLDAELGSVRGISLAEYRLLRSLADAPDSRASRVDLARRIGLTPSGVTRALRPLEGLGYVATVKNERDARLAVATLTKAGSRLVADASGVIDDAMVTVLQRTPLARERHADVVEVLAELARL